ncbi:hypothetical protein MPSEU_001022100 [Mayamaea pseudoterrestris]|nr:hypothetical protein MPSEU_001022100 [Mayamaea pseudoterrestris]
MTPTKIRRGPIGLFLALARLCVTASEVTRMESFDCRSAEDGSITCSFTLQLEQINSKNNNKLKLEDCLTVNDESVCVKAEVFLTENVRRNDKSHEEQQTAPPSSTYTHDVSGITIGRIRYNKPYAQYPYDISSSLIRLEFNAQSARHAVTPTDQAQVLITIGLAHQALLQEYMEECDEYRQTSGQSATFDMKRVDLLTDQSMNALEQAVQVHRKQLASISRNEESVQQVQSELVHSNLLAHLYFHMSDLWSLVAYFDESKRPHAKEYMMEAMELFRFCKDAQVVDDLAYDEEQDGFAEYASGDRLDAAYYWGQSLVRLGVLQMSVTQNIQLEYEQYTAGTLVEELSDEVQQNEILKRYTASMKDMTNSIHASQQYFEQGAEFFRSALESFKSRDKNIHPAEIVLYQVNLASALQHMGENKIALHQLAGGTEDGEQALTVYYEILESQQHLQPVDLQDAYQSMANLLVWLSRAFLQQAEYEKASMYYHKAMDWYAAHGISPSKNVGEAYKFPGTDGTIEQYEDILEEYKMLSYGGVDLPEEVSGYNGENEGIPVDANEMYVSAIHSTLGYLYMSNGDLYQATSHMSQALFLFRKNAAEEDESLADLLYNMAIVKFSSGEFKESVLYFNQAIEVFRNVVPEGQNPLSRGADSMGIELMENIVQDPIKITSPPVDSDNQATAPIRKVLQLKRIEENGPTIFQQQRAKTKQAPETGSDETNQPKLSLNLDTVRSQLLNETRDEL